MAEESTTIPEELVKEFVMAGHGNLPKVRDMLARHPSLLDMAYRWSETDQETAIQGAAQVGSVETAEFLLSKGAPLSICTAAMLGRKAEVQNMLAEDPSRINSTGAHGIPLLTHAAWSRDLDLVRLLYGRGAHVGASSAIFNSLFRGSIDVTRWLLENASPDLASKNFQGKTALEVAKEKGDQEAVYLLLAHGAS